MQEADSYTGTLVGLKRVDKQAVIGNQREDWNPLSGPDIRGLKLPGGAASRRMCALRVQVPSPASALLYSIGASVLSSARTKDGLSARDGVRC
jgi:hypothetical protein